MGKCEKNTRAYDAIYYVGEKIQTTQHRQLEEQSHNTAKKPAPFEKALSWKRHGKYKVPNVKIQYAGFNILTDDEKNTVPCLLDHANYWIVGCHQDTKLRLSLGGLLQEGESPGGEGGKNERREINLGAGPSSMASVETQPDANTNIYQR